MSLPITIPYTFATQSGSIPLSQIDGNFTTVSNAINGIGNGTNALANANITGGTITNVTITGLASVLSVANGGTGVANLTANAVVIGNGTGSVTVVAPGSSGNVLTSDGNVWISQAGNYPPVANNAGKVLQTDGSTVSWSTNSAVRARASFTNGTTIPAIVGTAVNVSTITRFSSGRYDVTFSANLTSNNYQVIATISNNDGSTTNNDRVVQIQSKTVSGFRLYCYTPTIGVSDVIGADFVVFGGF